MINHGIWGCFFRGKKIMIFIQGHPGDHQGYIGIPSTFSGNIWSHSSSDQDDDPHRLAQ